MSWTEFWNNRFDQEEYVYGLNPNSFLKQEIDKLKGQEGQILLPAEGEGRNALYCNQIGWKVSAFDISSVGKEKALKLHKKHQFEVDYRVGRFLEDIEYPPETFDAIGLCYAHFPPSIRGQYHKQLAKTVKKGAYIILEGFSKKHFELKKTKPHLGGPKEEALMFSKEMMKKDFENFDFLTLVEEKISLNSGAHQDEGWVIRMLAQKK
ncbi:MAG: class I SAM-dependent methyltransferase [Flavobacteriales bacterium]|jgi:hypothetical protein|nr:class I SAM-dependent methyltransferase [Flavobacteriales bacterium]